MRKSKAAYRYATSLLELSLEKGMLEAVKADMDLIRQTCAESHELDLLLHSPIIKADKKFSILSAIFGKSIDNLTMQFIRILTLKDREDILLQICEAFSTAYKAHKGIVSMEVTSARPLTDEERKAITEQFKASGIHQIELTERVDKAVIGGLKVKMGDHLIDATFLKKLTELQKQVSKNSNISDQ